MTSRQLLNIAAAVLTVLIALSPGAWAQGDKAPASGKEASAPSDAGASNPDVSKLPSKVVISGKIVRLAAAKRLVVLRLSNGKEKSYTVTKDAWILRNKVKAGLGEFRAGESAALGICSPLNATVLMVNLVMDEATHREYAAKRVPPSVYVTQGGKSSSTSSTPFLSRTGGGMTASPSPSQLPAMPPDGPAAPVTTQPPMPPAPGAPAMPYGSPQIPGASGSSDEEGEDGGYGTPAPGGAAAMQVIHVQGQVTQVQGQQRLVFVVDSSTGATLQVHIDARLTIQDVRQQKLSRFENIRVGTVLDVQGLQSGPIVEARVVYIR